MRDRIYVTYSPIGSAYSPIYHATLNYERTNAAGDVILRQTMDAGPSGRLRSDQQMDEASEEPKYGPDKGLSRFGFLDVGTDYDAVRVRPTYPYEVVGVGDDLSSNWARMLDFKNEVNAKGHVYRARTQNSNTFANAALAAGGMSPARGLAIDPITGSPVLRISPALRETLLPPIGGATPTPFTHSRDGSQDPF